MDETFVNFGAGGGGARVIFGTGGDIDRCIC